MIEQIDVCKYNGQTLLHFEALLILKVYSSTNSESKANYKVIIRSSLSSKVQISITYKSMFYSNRFVKKQDWDFVCFNVIIAIFKSIIWNYKKCKFSEKISF